ELGLDGDLEVMAGDRLVVGHGCDLVDRPRGRLVGVDEVDTWPRAVRRRREVERGGRLGRRVGLDRADLAGRLRQTTEPARGGLGGVLDLASGELDEVVGI